MANTDYLGLSREQYQRLSPRAVGDLFGFWAFAVAEIPSHPAAVAFTTLAVRVCHSRGVEHRPVVDAFFRAARGPSEETSLAIDFAKLYCAPPCMTPLAVLASPEQESPPPPPVAKKPRKGGKRRGPTVSKMLDKLYAENPESRFWSQEQCCLELRRRGRKCTRQAIGDTGAWKANMRLRAQLRAAREELEAERSGSVAYRRNGRSNWRRCDN